MRYCKYCGQALPDDARFCFACGKEIPAEPQQSQRQSNRSSRKNDDGKPAKKQSSLWGCFFILFVIAIFAGSAIFTYFKYLDHNHNNALVPHEEDSTQMVVEDEEDVNQGEEEKDDSKEASQTTTKKEIQKRVEKIYDDALSMNKERNYVARYCSEELRSLIQRANGNSPNWLDFNIWVSDDKWNSPRVEQVRVFDYSSFSATVKVTIRPESDDEEMNFVTLSLIKEDGEWLIDDFKSEGRSLKTQARRAAEDGTAFENDDEDDEEYPLEY